MSWCSNSSFLFCSDLVLAIGGFPDARANGLRARVGCLEPPQQRSGEAGWAVFLTRDTCRRAANSTDAGANTFFHMSISLITPDVHYWLQLGNFLGP